MRKMIVFTDLDGTLLDEATYSADASLPALRNLQERGAAIVFCSSKTSSEQAVIRAGLGIRDPFIVENGSAVVIPPGTLDITGTYVEAPDHTKILVLGLPIADLRAKLKQVVAATGIVYQSFLDLSNEQVAELTGLDIDSAARARAREFTETVVTKLNAAELAIFMRACEAYGLQCIFGGRFLSISGEGADKGSAVRILAEHYRAQFCDILTIGIGDSPNDAPMLQAVDRPYLVQRPDGRWRAMDIANLQLLPAIGPLGFVEMAEDVMRRWLRPL